MTRVSATDWATEWATEWTATIESTAGTTLSHKYDLGGSWSTVEKGAGCAEIPNRSTTVNGGTVTDTVINWAGLGAC
jgi:glucoamylase